MKQVSTFEVEGPSTSARSLSQHELQQTTPKHRRRRPGKASDVFTDQPDKEITSFQGFRSPWWKKLLFYFVGVLTAGFSFLLCKWSPRLHILLSLSPCHLRDAQYVRIRLADGRVDLEPVHLVAMAEHEYDSQPADEEDGGRGGLLDWQTQRVHRLLEYRCTRFFYVEGRDGAGPRGGSGVGGTFMPVPAVPKGFPEQLQAAAQTLAATGQATAVEHQQQWDLRERQLRYGTNEMAIPVKSIPMLVFNEMWHPFYVFQYFSILIWVVGDEYYSYAICIAVITWFSIISAAVEAHQNMKRLAEIAHFECEVEVLRAGEVLRLSSSALVPGDLVVVGPGTLPCDMVLLRGECILDENMLTGESVPVRKVPYNPVADGLSYEPDKCPGCTLFGGTVVAQARAPRNQKAVAVVCRTRFYSAKGQLLRSILFPREHEESFISDSLRFICVMLAACMGLYIWAAVVLASIGATPDRIVVRFFDMITIAVPPALPACLTIATVFSIGRLRKKGIYVTSPDRITLAGQLDVICFDKTGTLTEQGLDLQGIVPVVGGQLHQLVSAVSLLPAGLVELLASCHGLARMGEALVGDPLDQKLFQATQWDLIDERPSLEGQCGGSGEGAPPEADHGSVDGVVGQVGDGAAAAAAAEAAAEATGTGDVHTYVRPPGAANAYAIIKRFEFSAALQRNLVVVRAPDASVAVFAKGSPEALRTLVDPASVPHDFDALLGEYTREGLRVLALAAGDASAVPQDVLLGWTQAQTEGCVRLRLVGLAVMANPLRPDTADVIARLQHASIRTVMVTGDHLRTAVSVAHKCFILPAQRRILLVDAADTPQLPTTPDTTTDVKAAAQTTSYDTVVAKHPALTSEVGSADITASATYLEPAHTSAPMPVVHRSRLFYTASGPGPAGEPTPLGDPSIQTGGWGRALLQDDNYNNNFNDSPAAEAAATAAPAPVRSPSTSPPRDSLPSDVMTHTSWPGPNGHTSAAYANTASSSLPVSTIPISSPTVPSAPNAVAPSEGVPDLFGSNPPAATAPGASGHPGLRLSILDADGNVADAATGPSSLMAAVLAGDLDCAVTGKGFSWLLSHVSVPGTAGHPSPPHQQQQQPENPPGGSVAAGGCTRELLLPVLKRVAVFARMSPDNKRDLMLLLGGGIDGLEGCPHLGLRAGFCGDGANDCGALKAAHVGVSLCEAEASVAAPMTSKAQTIAAMITVVAEGRCTLMATYQIFQFIIAYALVQAFETNLMYTYALNLGNYQYLIEDLFFTTVLAALMGFTEPRNKLSRSRPLNRVLSLPLMISTVAQCCVVVVFQLASLALLQAQPGYVRFRGGPELHDTVAPENTVTYIVALAQFVVLAMVFNKGMPHRSPIWTNGWLVAALAVQGAFVLYTLFSTDRFNREVQQLVGRDGVMDTQFRWKLFALLVVMGVTAIAAEYASMGLVRLIDCMRGRGRAPSIPSTVMGAPRMDQE